jgi:hypothetical protein
MKLKFYWAVFLLYVTLFVCKFGVGCDPSFPNVYLVLVCGKGTQGFQLGYYERGALLALCTFGVFGDVIPKYIRRESASRHLEKRNSPGGNPMLFIHIITGAFTVLFTGAAGMFGGLERNSVAMFVLVIVDLVHQLSIVRMVKNHDGVFALRIGNFVGALLKYITILNIETHTPYMVDILFIQNYGFMGTRLAGTLSALHAMWTKDGDSWIFERFYSIGLLAAHSHVILRLPQFAEVWLIICPFIGYFYYHELWPREFKLQFLLGNIVVAIVGFTFFGTYLQLACIAAYNFWTFRYPIFYRFPKQALAQYYNKGHKPTNKHSKTQNGDPNKEIVPTSSGDHANSAKKAPPQAVKIEHIGQITDAHDILAVLPFLFPNDAAKYHKWVDMLAVQDIDRVEHVRMLTAEDWRAMKVSPVLKSGLARLRPNVGVSATSPVSNSVFKLATNQPDIDEATTETPRALCDDVKAAPPAETPTKEEDGDVSREEPPTEGSEATSPTSNRLIESPAVAAETPEALGLEEGDELASDDELSPLSRMSWRRESLNETPQIKMRAIRGTVPANDDLAAQGWKFSGATPWVSPNHTS